MDPQIIWLLFQMLALSKDAYFQQKRLEGKTDTEIQELWASKKDSFNEENPDLPDV